jgi:pimeloyl-ACP methyl ester carboxylesterase
MNNPVKSEDKFQFIETEGSDKVILLLHGLFGALSNFGGILSNFGKRYNVVVPLLPIYTLPLRKVYIQGIVEYVIRFVEFKDYKNIHILGNSLGGHVALLYALRQQERLGSMTLTGSSGLFESGMGSTFPKRGNYDFIKKKAEDTFFDPRVANKELVDEVYDIVNDRNKAIRVIATAKSAIRHNVGDKLDRIKIPTLLIWGKQDTITPHYVGERFNELIANSKLFFIDKCGHAPMMEHPDQFNKILDNFLDELYAK